MVLCQNLLQSAIIVGLGPSLLCRIKVGNRGKEMRTVVERKSPALSSPWNVFLHLWVGVKGALSRWDVWLVLLRQLLAMAIVVSSDPVPNATLMPPSICLTLSLIYCSYSNTILLCWEFWIWIWLFFSCASSKWTIVTAKCFDNYPFLLHAKAPNVLGNYGCFLIFKVLVCSIPFNKTKQNNICAGLSFARF